MVGGGRLGNGLVLGIWLVVLNEIYWCDCECLNWRKLEDGFVIEMWKLDIDRMMSLGLEG